MVSRSSSGSALTINYTLTGTATSGIDYNAIPGGGTLTIPAGQATATLTIDPISDATVEIDETVTVTLTTGAGYTVGSPSSATGTILNDDTVASPAISISAVSSTEGNSGTKVFSFPLMRSGSTAGASSVAFTTANGTATGGAAPAAGVDFISSAGTATFAAGVTSTTINISVLGDTVSEANETFTVQLSNPTGATLSNSSAVGTILNDDAPPAIEGDVVDASGGPNGDGSVLSNDVVRMRGLIAGSGAAVASPSQYQRADVNSCGDGRIDAADITVVRLFLLGTLTPATACGPTADVTPAPSPTPGASSVVHATNATTSPGEQLTVAIQMDAQGNENSLSFSLNFDPAVFSYTAASIGSQVPAGTTLTINPGQMASGRLGVLLDSTNTYAPGTRHVLSLILTAAAGVPAGVSPISFGNTPTPLSVANTTPLSAVWNAASITVNGPSPTPTATVSLTPSPTPVSCSTVQFNQAATFLVGLAPRSVKVGDLNGDGKQDLAVMNTGNGTISILPGNGNGGFGVASNTTAGGERLALGDFNGDGKPDIATTIFSQNRGSILLGNGSGGFTFQGNYFTAAQPIDLAIGDLNADGKLDLVTSEFSAVGNVSTIIGNGSGGFTLTQPANNQLGHSSPQGVALGDFNTDGKMDVAAVGQGFISILLGDGLGGLGGRQNFFIVGDSYAVTTGDFNNDGKLDIATANYPANNVAVLIGSGTGSFSSPTYFSAGTGPNAIVTGDFNGDGKTDLATANRSSNSISVLIGNGSGGFAAPLNLSGTTAPFALATGDFNADGLLDIVSTNDTPNSVSVFIRGCSSPSPSPTPTAPPSPTPTSTPACAAPNLLQNPGAESGSGSASGYDVLPIPGWTAVGNSTAVLYNAPDFFDAGSLLPPNRGNNFFAGGPSSAGSSLTQTLDVSSLATGIDTGNLPFQMSGYLGGYASQSDRVSMKATFENANGVSLGETTIGPVTNVDRGNTSGMIFRIGSGNFPAGTRRVRVSLNSVREVGEYNDGYADELSFIACTSGPPASPTPTPTLTPTPNPTPEATPLTPAGPNVTTSNPVGNGSVTFSNVSSGGTTAFTPINPSTAGLPPSGFTVLGGNTSYNISTTAAVTPPIVVCFTVNSVNDANLFSFVRILHGENGQLVDRTILNAADGPVPDFATRRVCAKTDSLSPFVASLAPGSGAPSVAGSVTYGTAPAAQGPRAVPGVVLTAAVAATPQLVGGTGANGAYSLAGFAGGAYTVTPSKTGDLNGSISGLDAARVAQHVAGLITLTPNQQIAGDATNNGSLSGLDAARIAQFAAGLANPGIAGQWKFLPASKTYQSVPNSLTGENYEAILVGDVTGNWAPAAARPDAGGAATRGSVIGDPAYLPEKLGGLDSDVLYVDLPPIGVAARGAELTVPISVSDTTGKGILAYDFTIRFDPTVLSPADVALDTSDTLSDGWTVMQNTLVPGQIRVSAFSMTPMTGKGALLKLRFDTVGGSERSGRLEFSALEFNEDEVPVSIKPYESFMMSGSPRSSSSALLFDWKKPTLFRR